MLYFVLLLFAAAQNGTHVLMLWMWLWLFHRSLGGSPASLVASGPGGGRSGADFFTTVDGTLIVKSLPPDEASVLLRLLESYTSHAIAHAGTTLLPRFLCLVRVRLRAHTTTEAGGGGGELSSSSTFGGRAAKFFVVMPNLLHAAGPPDQVSLFSSILKILVCKWRTKQRNPKVTMQLPYPPSRSLYLHGLSSLLFALLVRRLLRCSPTSCVCPPHHRCVPPPHTSHNKVVLREVFDLKGSIHSRYVKPSADSASPLSTSSHDGSYGSYNSRSSLSGSKGSLRSSFAGVRDFLLVPLPEAEADAEIAEARVEAARC